MNNGDPAHPSWVMWRVERYDPDDDGDTNGWYAVTRSLPSREAALQRRAAYQRKEPGTRFMVVRRVVSYHVDDGDLTAPGAEGVESSHGRY